MKTKIIWITSSTILFIAIIIWFVVDRVGTDLDKSIYYLTDEYMEEKISNSSYRTYSQCEVTRVVDGDTIDVDCPFNKNETIRYAYLDTPEVWKKANGKWEEDNQCFGKEASSINALCVLDNGKALNISQLSSLIKDSSFVISNDTGPAHIAAHLNSLGISLFGEHTTAAKVSIERENFKAIQVSDLKKLSAKKVLEKILI